MEANLDYYLADIGGQVRTIWGPAMTLARARKMRKITDMIVVGPGCRAGKKMRIGEMQVAFEVGSISRVHSDGSLSHCI